MDAYDATVDPINSISSGMTVMRSRETPADLSSFAKNGEFESVTFPERISLPITTIAAVFVADSVDISAAPVSEIARRVAEILARSLILGHGAAPAPHPIPPR